MVRFPSVPMCLVILTFLYGVGECKSSVSSVHADTAAVQRCYAWKVRVDPSAQGSAKGSTAPVESIVSSRCRAEIPACKISVEVTCGQALKSDPPVPCQPCGTQKCESKKPTCRYVSRTYQKGNCEKASADGCREWAKTCIDVDRIREQYYNELKALCPQASDDFEVRLRTESLAP